MGIILSVVEIIRVLVIFVSLLLIVFNYNFSLYATKLNFYIGTLSVWLSDSSQAPLG